MSDDTTPRLNLPLIGDHAQKKLVMNDALMRLESLVQAQVKSRTLSAQPPTPADGDSYILTAAPTGTVWSLLTPGTFVRAEGGTWEVVAMPDGALVHIADEHRFVVRSGGAWVALETALTAFDNLTRLGIATTADSTNVLSVRGPAALLSARYAADGGSGDISLTVNKEADTDTAQILLQTGFSTRAIVGLLGDNNLTLKVSPDGSAFVTALSIERTTAMTSLTGLTVRDAADPTKQARLDVAGVSTNTLRTLNLPNASGTVALLGGLSQTFTSTVTFSGTLNHSGTTLNLGTSTAATTYGIGTGATTSGATKTINLGTSGAAGSTTALNLGAQAVGATTALTVYGAAPVFHHAGGSVQMTLNKLGAGDTASLVLKTAGSGRAEFGTLGNGHTTLKVSGDGTLWQTSFVANRHTGRLRLNRPLYQTPNVPRRNHLTGNAWLSSTSAADHAWNAVCWSPELGLFCAVAASGTGTRVMTSPNGITWTLRSSAADNSWRDVCWSAELGLFCAVAITGTGNRVMTSADGITWTARVSAADLDWFSVCWSPERGLFCAVAVTGTGGRVMTSADGITWTTRTSAADSNWRSVCWAGDIDLFCAVSSSGTVMTSPDGVTWTLRTAAASNGWYSVCWSPELGLLCAVAITGTGNRVMTSPDGITWTARVSAVDNDWRSVQWAAEIGLFCAVASSGSGNRVMTSPDGITWTARSSATDTNWRGSTWSAELGLVCAVGDSGTGNRAMTSVSIFTFPYRS